MSGYNDGPGSQGSGGQWRPTESVPVYGGPSQPPGFPPTPPTPSPKSSPPTWLWVVMGALGLLVVLSLGSLVAVFVMRSGKTETNSASAGRHPDAVVVDDQSTTTPSTTPSTDPPVTVPPPTVVDTTVAAPAVIGDVRSEPVGLFCKDLKAKGYSYSAAVDYWRSNGQTNSMDADRNGIPCETVYPRADITAYWPTATYEAIPSYGLPSGLLCKDLRGRGVDVYDAFRYYIWEGYPSRMDADGNGIPCETVYPNARTAWLYEF